LAACVGVVQADAAHVDHVRIVGVDAHLAEIHRARVDVVHLAPRGAAVIRSIEAGRGVVDADGRAASAAATAASLRRFFRARLCAAGRAGAARTLRAARRPLRTGPAAAAAARRRAFDRRIKNVGALAIDVEADAAERSFGQAGLQPRPRVAAVGGLPDAAARTDAVHAARGAPPLIRGGVQDAVVGRVDDQVVGAGVVVDLQRLLPRLAAVGGLEDAALAAGAEQRPGRRHPDDVVVARVDDDAVDVLRRLEADVAVGLAAVRGLVDGVAPRRALSGARLAGADVDEIGVVLRHGDVADRHQAHVLELRLERGAAVDGLPHAAVRGAD